MSQTRRRNRSCNECTRKKTRCDGKTPCKNCKQHLTDEKCVYRQRDRRTNPSWKAVAELSESLEAHSNILKQLLPAVDCSALSEHTKREIQRLTKESTRHTTPSTAEISDLPQNIAEHPDFLHVQPRPDHEWTEAYASQNTPVPVADDVNGLAPQRPTKSFIGLSSPGTVLRVLFAISQEANTECTRLERASTSERNAPGAIRSATLTEASVFHSNPVLKPPFPQQVIAVDAYFSIFHPAMPMIDEGWFRTQFAEQNRTDSSWTALSNIILALGSTVAGDDESHVVYHQHARGALGYDVFCSGDLEMLQALVLLGGLYLHYTNAPNSAYMVRGTAFRMAIAMGIHRESVVSARTNSETGDTTQQGSASVSRAELQRRTWWSLVNSDVLGAMLCGRPRVLGWDPLTMDVNLPSIRPDQTTHADSIDRNDGDIPHIEWVAQAFRLQAEFSAILSRVQERMARLTQLAAHEVITLHEQLQAWIRSHLLQKQSTSSCPKSIRQILETQYVQASGACLMLSQPHLLHLAICAKEQRNPTPDDWQVVAICQDAASTVIASISMRHPIDRAIVWHSTFHLFQACLILLLSVALAPELNSGQDTIDGWMQNLETARHSFKQMAPFTRRSDRYGDIVESLYDVLTATSLRRQQSPTLDGSSFTELCRATREADTEYSLDLNLADLVGDGFPHASNLDFDFYPPSFDEINLYQPGNDYDFPGW